MLNQHRLIRSAYSVVITFSIVALTLFALTTPTRAQSAIDQSIDQSTVFQADAMADFPPDPSSDIPWSGSVKVWSDMVAAFNAARLRENELLGTSLSEIIFPAATVWEGMSMGERALWLINEERSARGLAPLQGVEQNVTGVAQTYAEFLLANNAFDHDADGRSPWERLADNATIGACQDFLSIAENIYFQATTSANAIPLIIEQAIYKMLYDDSSSQWGHRHAIFWTPYTENSGASDREGFVGIGHANGGYTSPFNGHFYQNTDMIVMNFFDPCATWVEAAPITPSPTASPSPTTPSPTTSPTPTSSPTSPVATATPTPTPRPGDAPTPPLTRNISGRVIIAVSASERVAEAASGLAGVTISSDRGQSTVSDSDGYFTLQGLSPQSYLLTASKAGYAFDPSSIEANVSADDLYGVTFSGNAGPTGTTFSYSIHLPLILPKH